MSSYEIDECSIVLNPSSKAVLVNHGMKNHSSFRDKASISTCTKERNESYMSWHNLGTLHLLEQLQGFCSTTMVLITSYQCIPRN
uniref:Uncharacterized protein n=1 Tax=Arundo donax TaxID=35708 RepID=A0A0A9A1B0_ARUDO